jgi:UDP-GlcNAc:undecaprenyl-phosphate GlcNAc-1-phosphate transferase
VLLPAALGGIAEDMTQRLSVRYRLSLTGASGVLAVLLLDLTLPRTGWMWADSLLATAPWLGMAIVVLAVAGLPHAFNIIDGYNGLAGMVALIVCLALAHVALQVGDRSLAALLVCTAAATGGFLVWNYPRGMLFAGDGGAYIWGVVIALASISLVQRNADVSPWFPMLLLIYPVWETIFSIYRKAVRGVSPGVADALHFHQLIYRRIVRGVFHDDESRRVLMRNNRTSPYLWGFTLLTVVPAVLFWGNSPLLMAFCGLFVVSYVMGYFAIVRFKVPSWLRH